MVRKQFYNIEDISTMLGMTNAAIYGHLARKQFDAVPPPIKLGRRLAWLVDAVDLWIKDKATQATAKLEESLQVKANEPTKMGRPTKAFIKARSKA